MKPSLEWGSKIAELMPWGIHDRPKSLFVAEPYQTPPARFKAIRIKKGYVLVRDYVLEDMKSAAD